MDLDVVTVGEAMVLFAAQQPGPLEAVACFARSTAGAELNVAVGLSRLGLRVGYVSRLGCDSFGRYLLAALDREGIDRRHVTVDEAHPTGFMLKSLADDGSDPRVEYFRRGSAASRLGPADNPRGYFAQSRHLHLASASPSPKAHASSCSRWLPTPAPRAGAFRSTRICVPASGLRSRSWSIA